MKGKRKIFLIVIVIMLLFSLVLLNSYAWWRITRGQTDSNTLIGGCLNIDFEEVDNSNEGQLVFEKRFPITDEQALSLNGYTFKLTNTCPNEVNYEVVLHSIPKDRQIPDDLVKVQIDDKNPKPFSDYLTVDDNTKKIHTGTLLGQTDDPNNDDNKVTHTVKMWISDEAETNDVADKEFETIVEVRAGQGIQNDMEDDELIADTCFVINAAGTLVKYNPDCGSNVTIPATYNGLPIKTISSTAFSSYLGEFDTYGFDIGNGKANDIDRNEIVFEIAYSDKIINMMMQEEGDLSSVTNDDVWIVKFKSVDNLDSYVNQSFDESELGIVNGIKEGNPDFTVDKKCDANSSSCSKGSMGELYGIDSSTGELKSLGLYIRKDVLLNIYGMTEEEAQQSDDRFFNASYVDFSQATNLETIEENAFSELNDGNLNFASSVQNIGLKAFYNYNGSNITFGDNLKTIGDAAFYSYNGNDITFKDNVESIGRYAFYSFVGNEGLTLPNKLESVGEYAFAYFNGSNLTLDNNLKTIGDSAFNSYEGEYKELIIPESVTTIGAAAFREYLGKGQTLVIPDNVTSIGKMVFEEFRGDNLILSNSLTKIPNSAFDYYEGIGQNLTIPNSVTEIEYYAFGSFNGSNLSLGTGLKTIHMGAFAGYRGMGTTLIIPEGVEAIGGPAFKSFNGDNIVVPSTINLLEDDAFYPGVEFEHNNPENYFPDKITIKMTESDFISNVNYWHEQSNTIGKLNYNWLRYSQNNTELIFDPNYDTSSYIHQGN